MESTGSLEMGNSRGQEGELVTWSRHSIWSHSPIISISLSQYSNSQEGGSFWPVCVCSHVCICAQMLSCVWFFVILWTVAHQAPLSMELPRQEYWSELPFSPPADLSNPGIEFGSLVAPALTGGFFTTEPTGKSIWPTFDHMPLPSAREEKPFFKIYFWLCWVFTAMYGLSLVAVSSSYSCGV